MQTVKQTNILKEVEYVLQRWLNKAEAARALRLIKGGMHCPQEIIFNADLKK